MDITPTDWEAAQREFDRVAKMMAEKEGRLEGRGSQQIGSLVDKIVSLPSTLGSTPEPSPTNSGTTGTARRALAPQRSTGQQLGVIGAGELAPIEQAWAERDADALETGLYRLLKRLPTSLKPLSGADYEMIGWERVGNIEPATKAMLQGIARRITEPTGPTEAVKLITRLLMATKSREPDGIDLRSMIALLAEDLAEFPIDVLATACRKHARQEKWWPSLSEIREQCHRAARWRKSLQKALAQPSGWRTTP